MNRLDNTRGKLGRFGGTMRFQLWDFFASTLAPDEPPKYLQTISYQTFQLAQRHCEYRFYYNPIAF